MNSKYEAMSLAQLKAEAKEKGLKNVSALRKHELVNYYKDRQKRQWLKK